ncbi:MAG: hypothetical protein HN380_25960 [Victivallales bacterium]|nr:hypothetical protein [Victivallales bacterium]
MQLLPHPAQVRFLHHHPMDQEPMLPMQAGKQRRVGNTDRNHQPLLPGEKRGDC